MGSTNILDEFSDDTQSVVHIRDVFHSRATSYRLFTGYPRASVFRGFCVSCRNFGKET